jgi:hypothetical protein
MMGKIYQHAARTIVWLGDSPHAEQSLSLLLDLKDRPWELKPDDEAPQVGKDLVEWYREQRKVRFSMLEPGDFRLFALARILENDWFYRIWILQEVIFSKKIHIRAGGVWIDWELFSSVMKLFSDPETYLLVGRETLYLHMKDAKLLRQIFLLAHARDAEVARRQSGRLKPKLNYLLANIWKSEATDARDMIYGLLNLCSEATDPVLAPDYQQSPLSLYMSYAKMCFERKELQQILYTSGFGYRKDKKENDEKARDELKRSLPLWIRNLLLMSDKEDEQQTDDYQIQGTDQKYEEERKELMHSLPSWIPNWSSMPMVLPLQDKMYKAGGKTTPDFKLLSPNTLAVKGFFVCKIVQIAKESFSSVNFAHMNLINLQTIEENRKEVEAQNMADTLPDQYDGGLHHPKPQSRREAFWRTLIGDTAAVPLRHESETHTASQLGFSPYSFDLKYDRPAPPEYGSLFAAECALRRNRFPQLEPNRAKQKSYWAIDWEAHRRDPGFRAAWERARKEALEHPSVLLESDTRFTDAFVSCSSGRKFAITEHPVTKEKRMALVPPESDVGDDVCIICGLNVPFVLRRSKAPSAGYWFQLAGACYLHGIMDGECVDENILRENFYLY